MWILEDKHEQLQKKIEQESIENANVKKMVNNVQSNIEKLNEDLK